MDLAKWRPVGLAPMRIIFGVNLMGSSDNYEFLDFDSIRLLDLGYPNSLHPISNFLMY